MEVTEYFYDQNLSFIRLSNLPELFPDHDGFFAVQGGIISDVCKTVSSFPYIITDTNIVHGFIEENLFEQFITKNLKPLSVRLTSQNILHQRFPINA
mgnify:CR=1 FL=1